MDNSVIKTRYGIPLTDTEQNALEQISLEQYSVNDTRWFGKTNKGWMLKFLGTKPAPIHQETVSVLVSSYNQLDKLKFFLESMYRQNELPVEVIVTDDGSTDGTIEWMDSLRNDQYPFPVRYVHRNHGGYRLASLQNFGARQARGTRLLFSNADVLHCPSSVSSHASMRGNMLGVGIIKGISVEGASLVTVGAILDFNQVLRLGETHQVELTNLKWGFYDLNTNPIAVWGGNFSVPAETFAKVGGFDESYVGWGGEDANLAGRCRDMAGCRLEWAKKSTAFHLGHPLRIYSYRQLGSIKYRSS
jgi:glycosyltransferase involved in cell wall biosynthesis